LKRRDKGVGMDLEKFLYKRVKVGVVEKGGQKYYKYKRALRFPLLKRKLLFYLLFILFLLTILLTFFFIRLMRPSSPTDTYEFQAGIEYP
jgi:hypothetical protein